MYAIIWCHELIDSEGRLIIGGMQVYLQMLCDLLESAGFSTFVLAPGLTTGEITLDAVNARILTTPHWNKGWTGLPHDWKWLQTKKAVTICLNAHAGPFSCAKDSIGIQHGLYCDRPSRFDWINRTPLAPLVNLGRLYRHASIVNRYRRLVCVDAVFPAVASTVLSPLRWDRIRHIPNAVRGDTNQPAFSTACKRFVFARRFSAERGVDLFCTTIRLLRAQGCTTPVAIFGSGPLKSRFDELVRDCQGVQIGRYQPGEAGDVLSSEDVVIVPSQSSEGTSLVVIEAWSKGAGVVATSIGGLPQLVQDGVSGYLTEPVPSRMCDAMLRAATAGTDLMRVRRAGYEAFRSGFSESVWRSRWHAAILEMLRSSKVKEL